MLRDFVLFSLPSDISMEALELLSFQSPLPSVGWGKLEDGFCGRRDILIIHFDFGFLAAGHRHRKQQKKNGWKSRKLGGKAHGLFVIYKHARRFG